MLGLIWALLWLQWRLRCRSWLRPPELCIIVLSGVVASHLMQNLMNRQNSEICFVHELVSKKMFLNIVFCSSEIASCFPQLGLPTRDSYWIQKKRWAVLARCFFYVEVFFITWHCVLLCRTVFFVLRGPKISTEKKQCSNNRAACACK